MFELDQYFLLNLIKKNKALKIIYSLSGAELDGISTYPAHFWRKLDHPAEYFFYILVAERKFNIIEKLNIPEGFAEHVSALNTPFIQMCFNFCNTTDEFQVLKRFLDCVISYDPNLLLLEDSNNDVPLKCAVGQNKVFAVQYLLDCFISNQNKLSKSHRQFFQLPQNHSDEINTELNKYGVCLLTYSHTDIVSPAFASPSAFHQAFTTQIICSDVVFWRYYLRDLYCTSKNIEQHLFAYTLFKTLDNHDVHEVLVDNDAAAHSALATELLSQLRVLSTHLDRAAYYHSLMPLNLIRRMSESLIIYFKNDKLRFLNANFIMLIVSISLLKPGLDPLYELREKAYNAHEKFDALFYDLTVNMTDCYVKNSIQRCELSLSKMPALIDCTSFNNTEICGLFNTTYSDCYKFTAQLEQVRNLSVIVVGIVLGIQMLNMFLHAVEGGAGFPLSHLNLFIVAFPFMVLSELLGTYQPYESKNKNAIISDIWSICESFSKIPCASLFEGNDEQTLSTLTNDLIISNKEIIQSIDHFRSVIEKYIKLVPQLPSESRIPMDSLESAVKKIKRLNKIEDNPRRPAYCNFFRSHNNPTIEMTQLANTSAYNNV